MISSRINYLGLLTLIGWAVATTGAGQAAPIIECEPKDNARPICGFTNPEDIVALPGDKVILIGEYGTSAEDHSGGLVTFNLETEAKQTVFRGGENQATAEAGWGDPTCNTPPSQAFNSHGIDLVRRNDGRLQLLVVQHGGREAIELFEVLGQGTDWQVEWRGCVASPENASLNEVAGLPNGDFVTTKMISLDQSLDDGFPAENSGNAFYWSAESGYRKIAGTDGILPNGIETSPGGNIVYMNVTGEAHIRKIEIATGQELGRAPVATPDNVTWSPQGSLYVASLGELDAEAFGACTAQTEGACDIPFKIIEVDPESMTVIGTVYESTGAPMGAGTVGLQVGAELFIGSFKGDRILRVDLSQ